MKGKPWDVNICGEGHQEVTPNHPSGYRRVPSRCNVDDQCARGSAELLWWRFVIRILHWRCMLNDIVFSGSFCLVLLFEELIPCTEYTEERRFEAYLMLFKSPPYKFIHPSKSCSQPFLTWQHELRTSSLEYIDLSYIYLVQYKSRLWPVPVVICFRRGHLELAARCGEDLGTFESHFWSHGLPNGDNLETRIK